MARRANTGVAIRDAALELFARRGFAGTSMRDIARHVEITPANLYNYTPSKEHLLWEVMEHIMTELLSDLDQTLTNGPCSGGRLVGFVRRHVAYHARNRREARVGNTQIEFLEPDHRKQTKAFRDAYERGLRSILQAGLDAGMFGASEVRFASFAILEMGISVSIWYRSDGELSVDELADLYVHFALRLVEYDAKAHADLCEDAACAAHSL